MNRCGIVLILESSKDRKYFQFAAIDSWQVEGAIKKAEPLGPAFSFLYFGIS